MSIRVEVWGDYALSLIHIYLTVDPQLGPPGMDTGVGLTLRLGVPDREGDVRLIGHVHRAVGGGHAGTWDQLRGQRVVIFEVIDRPQAVHIDGCLLFTSRCV